MLNFNSFLRMPEGEGGGGGGDDQGGGEQSPEWVKAFSGVEYQTEVFDTATKTKKSVTMTPDKDPSFTKFKTPQDFIKHTQEREALIGRKGIIVPDDKATPEEQEKFLTALGRPEKPEGYKLSDFKDLHPALKITPESLAGYQAEVHKMGLTNKQADQVNQFQLRVLNQALMEQEKAEQKKETDGETALRKDWGADYDKNIQTITKFLVKAGGQEALDSIGGGVGIKKNPVVARALAQIFSQLNEDSIKFAGGSNSGSPAGSETKEEALAKIKKMNEDPEIQKALTDDKHKDHRKLNQERLRLYPIAYPG